ncbi:MAG: AAA family ATPase [Alphaproteobacteria bacterium]|nr:AAA family ATPase [Alphaproteobacteria bacterium]MBU0792611.1 AAA family ATPase [Alphaproteobacteria bacterium]MBU0876755.1 AAA family ATPase [Alphaproteobacteria bacterium]MBU1769001.1 AAA family ATPase [Alphaproteobacteria bacterium]
MTGRVIVLNGVGSAGKTSAAKAFQRCAAEPWLHVSGDVFLNMIAPKMWGDPRGIIIRQFEEEGVPSVEIEMGVELQRLMEGMRASVAALAKAGNNCVVDDVMLSAADQESYRAFAADLTIQFVAIHAPLEVLEERERDRGDRLIGLSRWQFPRVHNGIQYDFEIDTSDTDPKAVAAAIASALHVPVTNR